jgi:hypothetical protein
MRRVLLVHLEMEFSGGQVEIVGRDKRLTYTIRGGLPCPSGRRPVSTRWTCTGHAIRRLRICGV